MVGTVNALGDPTTFAYNAANQLLSITDALNSVQTFAYDVEGNVATFTDARNKVTTSLGLAHKELKEYKAAAKSFRRAVNLQPDFNLYTMLANVELTFDPKLALADAEKALELAPNWVEALTVHKAAKQLIARKEKANKGMT